MMRDLFDVHPSFGLKPSERDGAHPRDLASFPSWWLGLPRDVRQARERDFFAALFTVLSGRERAAFQAPSWGDGTEESRELTPVFAQSLVASAPASLAVWDAHGPLIEVAAGWNGVAVWLSPPEAEEMRQALAPLTGQSREGAESAARAMLLRAAHVLVYIACIVPGFVVGRTFIDGPARYLVALAIVFVLTVLSIPVTRWMNRTL